jgi:hypothetical protein
MGIAKGINQVAMLVERAHTDAQVWMWNKCFGGCDNCEEEELWNSVACSWIRLVWLRRRLEATLRILGREGHAHDVSGGWGEIFGAPRPASRALCSDGGWRGLFDLLGGYSLNPRKIKLRL